MNKFKKLVSKHWKNYKVGKLNKKLSTFVTVIYQKILYFT